MNANHEPPWHDGLEGTPLDIAGSNAARLRVRAGPGTGKTYAMKRRVMRLLQDGVNPLRILVCTFTRTAARDVAREIAAMGVAGVQHVRAGTLHGFCFSVLQRAHVLPLTGRVPRPVIKFEERFLLEDLAIPVFGGIRECGRRLQAFNAAWARLQTDEPGWAADPVDQAFQMALLIWLRFHEGILVGELVPVTLQYLRDNPQCQERQAYDHVVVDEFQDLNRAEQALVELLAENVNLAIIGDEDQSIYSFKHAHPEGISTFHQHHADCHDENLTECRRCPTGVVELARALIHHNPTASGRPLQPRVGNPAGDIRIVQWTDADAEANGIAEFISRQIADGQVQPGQVLVLSPRRQFGYAIRDALRQRDVHAHSFFTEEALDGNPKDLTDSQAQQAFSLLTLLANADDRVALRCWCGFGSSSLATPGWRRLRQHANESGESPRQALERMTAGDLTIPYTRSIVDRFQTLQARMAQLAGVTGQALVDAVFPEAEPWAEPLRRIATDAEDTDSPYTPQTLVDAIRVGITQPELPTDVDFVRVMSLHKSKGLTADLVVIVGCIQGAIPTRADADLPEADRQRMLEEQRRLFYVAITRPRRTLILSSITFLDRDLAWRMRVPVTAGGNAQVARTITSQFIAELGPTRPNPITGAQLLAG